MNFDKNLDAELAGLSASLMDSNSASIRSSSEEGELTSGQLSQLYANWNYTINQMINDNDSQSQINAASQNAQTQETYYNGVVDGINTAVSNLSSALTQLSAFGNSIIAFMTTIASLISTKLG